MWKRRCVNDFRSAKFLTSKKTEQIYFENWVMYVLLFVSLCCILDYLQKYIINILIYSPIVKAYFDKTSKKIMFWGNYVIKAEEAKPKKLSPLDI